MHENDRMWYMHWGILHDITAHTPAYSYLQPGPQMSSKPVLIKSRLLISVLQEVTGQFVVYDVGALQRSKEIQAAWAPQCVPQCEL